MKNNKKAVLYARYSSNNQREESIDAQIRAINSFAESNGYTIINKYIDEAFSATTDNRPSFLQMIDDSSSGDFETILVHKLDRFARSRYHSTIYKHKLKQNNVNVISVLEQFGDNPESKFLEALLEAQAEYYSENLAREVRKGLKENGLKGLHTGGLTPLGYKLDKDKKLIICPDESQIIRLIFDGYTNKGYGYGTLAYNLNDKGYVTKRGVPFTKNSFPEILKNEKYTGTYIYNKSSAKSLSGTRNNHLHKSSEEIIRIENNHEAIIDLDLFEKTQIKLKNNKHKNSRNISRNANAKENYILTGLLLCRCGSRMSGTTKYSGRNKNKLSTYVCNHRYSKKSDCTNKEINKIHLENAVVNNFSKLFFTSEMIDILYASYATYHENLESSSLEYISYNKLKKQLKVKKNKLTNLLDLLLESNSDLLKEKFTILSNEVDFIEKEINSKSYLEKHSKKSNKMTKKDFKKLISNVKNELKLGNFEYTYTILKHYIENIYIDDKSIHIQYYKSNSK